MVSRNASPPAGYEDLTPPPATGATSQIFLALAARCTRAAARLGTEVLPPAVTRQRLFQLVMAVQRQFGLLPPKHDPRQGALFDDER
jgi:hypothetical protein